MDISLIALAMCRVFSPVRSDDCFFLMRKMGAPAMRRKSWASFFFRTTMANEYRAHKEEFKVTQLSYYVVR